MLMMMLRFALHVPKPMFVFAFEGALFAFIVNGDRFVLFALLPRRKPRTSRQCSRLIILLKELNLTSDGYSDSLAPFDRWPGFRVYCGSGTAAIHKPQQKPAGVYREKIFRAEPPDGGISFAAGPR